MKFEFNDYPFEFFNQNKKNVRKKGSASTILCPARDQMFLDVCLINLKCRACVLHIAMFDALRMRCFLKILSSGDWSFCIDIISDLKYVGETRYRSSYHKIICTVQLWQNVLKTRNLPFQRSISRVISRDFCCKQTAKVRTLGQLSTTWVHDRRTSMS